MSTYNILKVGNILSAEQSTTIITSTTTPETTTTTTTTPTTSTTTMTPYPPYAGKRLTQTVKAKDLLEAVKSKKEKLDIERAAIFTAQPGENWHDISITLYKNDENDEQFLVQFVVLNWVHKMQLSYLKKVGEKFEMIVEEKDDAEHFFDEQKEFVLMFNLRQANMDIIINENTFKWSFPMDENNRPDSKNRKYVNPEVGTIKIDADIIIKENMKAVYATESMIPLPLPLDEYEIDIVKGRVYKRAKWFEIHFYAARLNEPFVKDCYDVNKWGCIARLFIEVDFEKGKTVIGGYSYEDDNDLGGPKRRIEKASNAKFSQDGDFQMTLEYIFSKPRTSKFKVIYGNGIEDSYVANYIRHKAEFIIIFGDVYLLELSGFMRPITENE